MDTNNEPQRYAMWCRLINDYRWRNGNEKKQAKREFCKRLGLKPYQITEDNYMQYINPFDIYPIPVVAEPTCTTTNSFATLFDTMATKQKENAMNYYDHAQKSGPTNSSASLNFSNEAAYSKEKAQIGYLMDRLVSAYFDKEGDLKKAFHLQPDYPKTYKEAVERLKAGKFTIKFSDSDDGDDYGRSEDDEFDSYEFRSMFRWNVEPQDWPGFRAAEKELDKAKTTVKDQIMRSYDDGLAAIQDFESKTFH